MSRHFVLCARSASVLALCAALGTSGPSRADEVTAPGGMDIYILGEVHDNPAHHATQARLVASIAPRAMVWEMLSPEQVRAAEGIDRTDAIALSGVWEWSSSGWPDFSMYAPILAAAPSARLWGAAVPPEGLRRAMEQGARLALGDAPGFDAQKALSPLMADDLAERIDEQAQAHCNALPQELLPGMVEAQRLRDATLAARSIAALEQDGGPVVVITGTGHARRDRGVPALIAAVRPELRIWSLGQFEADPGPAAPFDAVAVAEPVQRPDPCLAFQ